MAPFFVLAIGCIVAACGDDDSGAGSNNGDTSDAGSNAKTEAGVIGSATREASADVSTDSPPSSTTDSSDGADSASSCGDGVVQKSEACDQGPCCDTACNFVVPAGAVEVKPGDDLPSIVQAHAAGTTYCVRAGEYRMQSVSPHEGDSFHAERGAKMTGARLLTLVKEGDYWVMHGITEHGQIGGECGPGYERCIYPEDLFLDDVPLVHATSLAQVAAGSYFLDYDAQTIYMADDPTGKRAELSSSRAAFEPTGAHVNVRGFIIEKYAIPAQMGAIGDQYPADGWNVEQNEVRFNHGTGINITNGGVMRQNWVHHNGQKGVGASGTGCLVENNEIAWNNYANYSWGWEGGGSKFSQTTNLVVRGNYAHDNFGPGLWTDINNTGTLYENNVAERNVWAGIFHEISFDCVIRNNTVKRNGLETKDSWIWGGQIQISTSQNCEVYGNTVVVDGALGGTAIVILEQDRGASYASKNNHVHDNEIHFLGANGTAGIAQDLGDQSVFTSNSFDANHYHAPDIGAVHFTWNNQFMAWSSFIAAGPEATGSIDTNVKP